jgi:dTDP-4-dehydrorhamnose reductase
VYFSTDYVFDGAKLAPYVEEDCPHPLNVYGTTKLGGEYFNLAYSRRSLVLRVSGLYGRIPSRAKGTNFVMTMLKAAKERPDVRVVDDERLSPTPTSVIAERTVDLLEAGAEGLYHLVSEGDCSWYEFAKTIFEALQLKTPLIPVHGDAFPSTVRRPSYSVLRNSRLEVSGLPPMPHWRDSLLDFLTPRNH